MPTFAITTLGCKVNQFESEAIAGRLQADGWHQVNRTEDADVCIVNTCAVTAKASAQSRQAVRQFARGTNAKRLIVTGCYAQMAAQALQNIQGIELVVGNAEKHRIPQILSPLQDARPPELSADHRNLPAQTWLHPAPVSTVQGRTRPFLKIQDGCNAFCTYCIVPHLRGRSRSMPADEVLAQVSKLAASGFYEVVLTGIHLGHYGLDLVPPLSLFDLLQQIETQQAIPRVRLSSIEPRELEQDLVRLVAASSRFCRHFHIPLQSADDDILRKMNRPYTRDFFRGLVHEINRLLPEAAVGVDLLVGFPGETQAAFEQTYNLVEQLPISYVHVFPYSARQGTPAARFCQQVAPSVIKARCHRLRALGARKKQAFCEAQLGSPTQVLVESQRDRTTGLLKGMSSNYLTVLFEGEDRLKNRLLKIRPTQCLDKGVLHGRMIDPDHQVI